VRPRAVTFDAFGTLVHHGLETIHEAAEAVARDHGLPDGGRFLDAWQSRYFALLQGPRFLTIAEANERSLREAAEAFGVRADLSAYLDTLFARWHAIRPYPETPAVLASLRGIPMAVVSNADHELLLQVLRRGGVSIPEVISSERARSYKPDAGIFREALRALGVPAGSVLHVGDSLDADVRGAAAVGMRTAWVNRHGGRADGVAPDHTIPDLAGVLDLV
jgi:2-haloacid dehalogenase/putative hydrolase of the HAD superfamily